MVHFIDQLSLVSTIFKQIKNREEFYDIPKLLTSITTEVHSTNMNLITQNVSPDDTFSQTKMKAGVGDNT
jgi:hypothetical protein